MESLTEEANFCACVLCGAPISSRRQPDLQWMGRFRAVYAKRGTLTAKISDIGYCRGFEWFIHIVSETGFRSRLTFNPNPRFWVDTMAQEFTLDTSVGSCDSWGYPFHTGCWEVFTYIRGPREVNAQSLFDLLRSFSSTQALLDFGHDYDGLWMTKVGVLNIGIDELPHRSLNAVSPEGTPWKDMEWFEIMSMPILQDFFHHKYIDTGKDTYAPKLSLDNETMEHQDAFSVLSIDIYSQIIQHLPLRSVFDLRLASRTCHNHGLNNTFWKSRFEVHHELGFIFRSDLAPSFPEENLDGESWESLVKFVWSLQGQNPALNNRRRVWRLAKNLLALLDRVEMVSHCAGIPLESTFEATGMIDPNAWITAYSTGKFQSFSHVSGFTPMYERIVEMPLDAVSVYASIVKFSGFTHVTGLRMVTEDDEEVCIGYNIPANDHLLTPEGIHIAGFIVVANHYGISGLAVISTLGHVSSWFGSHEGFAKRRLVLESSTAPKGISYIKCGFDAYKLYSLSISDGSPPGDNLLSNLDALDIMTWYPEVPSPHLSCVSLDPSQLWHNWPATTAFLGDINRHLYKQADIQITVKFSNTDDNPSVSLVEISSCDGTHRSHLGSYPHYHNRLACISVIRYSEGERIIGLTTFRDVRQLLYGFIIHTSFKRKLSSMPDNGNHPAPDLTTSHCIPYCGDIVGFYTQLSPLNVLTDLGLVCVKS